MKIPANVILLWPSTVASIPANWTRETALDAKFPKAWSDSVAPNNTGGASAHSHTGISHSHNQTDTHGHLVAYATSGQCDSYGGSTNNDPIAQCNHGHASSTITTMSGGAATSTIAYPTSTNNNRPTYYDFIFIKANTGGASIGTNTIGLWNSATVPANWLACTDGLNGAPALGNKYIRGAGTGADGGTTGGANTHTHVLDHSHSTSHSHTGTSGNDDNHPNRNNEGGSGGNKSNAHTHSVTLNSASVTTDTYTATYTSDTVEPAYKKVLAIQRGASGSTGPKGLIGLWLGSTASPPKGWKICNGQTWEDGVTTTPDLRDKYIKFANATGEIGNTGGANTHSHSASNSHTHSQSGTHTHTGSTGSAGGSTKSGPGGTSPGAHTHSLSSVGNNNATLTWDAATMSAQTSSNEPEYLTAAYIQLTKVFGGVRILDF